MKIAFFSTKAYERHFFETVNANYNHELVFLTPHLNEKTAILAGGFPGICVFLEDKLERQTLEILARGGTRFIALRCAEYNHVDFKAVAELGMKVVRVPAYSPYAVAEYTIALILTLNRKTHKAYNRVREGNFSLDGLLGFDLHGRRVGIFGTDKIGRLVGKILQGFGCKILAYDLYPDLEFAASGVEYVKPLELAKKSDIITLHCPLTTDTHHIVNQKTINYMKPGVMLINTSQGALIETKAIISGLKSKKIGSLALDLYKQEEDVVHRLLTFPNVIITGHQAFLTENTLHNIAKITFANIRDFEQGKSFSNPGEPTGFLTIGEEEFLAEESSLASDYPTLP